MLMKSTCENITTDGLTVYRIYEHPGIPLAHRPQTLSGQGCFASLYSGLLGGRFFRVKAFQKGGFKVQISRCNQNSRKPDLSESSCCARGQVIHFRFILNRLNTNRTTQNVQSIRKSRVKDMMCSLLTAPWRISTPYVTGNT